LGFAVLLELFSMPDTLDRFRQTGAYLTGHFRLSSGLHSGEYLQSALVLQHPALAEEFGRNLASKLRAVDIVASPAIGGLIIGHEVARALGARFIFAERDASGKMSFRRGFSVRPGETAVAVEDVVTTGGSVAEVIDLLRAGGAHVIAAAAIIDRSGGRAYVGVPRVQLAKLDVVSYQPDECPLCKDGIPIEKPGSRPAA